MERVLTRWASEGSVSVVFGLTAVPPPGDRAAQISIPPDTEDRQGKSVVGWRLGLSVGAVTREVKSFADASRRSLMSQVVGACPSHRGSSMVGP